MSIAARLRALERRRGVEAAGDGILFTWTDVAGEERAEVVMATGESLPFDQFRRRYPAGAVRLWLVNVDPERI